MIAARAVGLIPVDLFARQPGQRATGVVAVTAAADHVDEPDVDNEALAIALHRAALVVPLLPVPRPRVRPGSAMGRLA